MRKSRLFAALTVVLCVCVIMVSGCTLEDLVRGGGERGPCGWTVDRETWEFEVRCAAGPADG